MGMKTRTNAPAGADSIDRLHGELVSEIDDLALGAMFGKRCLKVFGKAFAAQFHDDMVFKLSGEHHEYAAALDGSCLWDPSGKGRAMKEWVQVRPDHEHEWLAMAKQAAAYVSQ